MDLINIFDRKKVLYLLSITGVVVLSFTFFSPYNYVDFSSDDALNVLMCESYQLPHDLYCWGQSRGGTIIPFFAQLFKFLNLNSLMSVSLANYLILIVGFVVTAKEIKKPFIRIFWAICIFLPGHHFMDIIRFPVGIQFLLFLSSIVYFKRFMDYNKYSYLLGCLLFYLLAVWTSEFVFISGVSFGLALLFSKLNGKLKNVLIFILISGLGILFYFILQNQTSFHAHHQTFNNWDDIISVLSYLYRKYTDYFLFRNGEWAYSIFVYILTFLLPVLIIQLKKKGQKDVLRLFLIIDIFLASLVLVSSKWVYENGVAVRYFFGVYWAFIFWVLLKVDQEGVKTKVIKYGLPILVFLSASTSFVDLYLQRNSFWKPKRKLISAINSLGKIGIIGDHWYSYVYAMNDPVNVKATVHDQGPLRNVQTAIDAMNCDKIYLCQNNWLDHFPDTIHQYGYCLKKVDESIFQIDDALLQRYQKVNIAKTFEKDDFIKKEANELIPDKLNCLFYGPFHNLPKGTYLLHFEIEGNEEVLIDVAHNYGERVFVKSLPKGRVEWDTTLNVIQFGAFFEYRIFATPKLELKHYSVEIKQN